MSETAKTLQRWGCHHEYIEKNEWGDWVSYDDAAKLLAEIERLRAALDRLARLGNEPHYGNSVGNEIAREALEEGGR
jgi:hypothetical protein